MSIESISQMDRFLYGRWINPIIICLVALGHACFMWPGFLDFQWQKKEALEISIELSDGASDVSMAQPNSSTVLNSSSNKSVEKKKSSESSQVPLSDEGVLTRNHDSRVDTSSIPSNTFSNNSASQPDQAARVVRNAKPIYPMSALAHREEGTVHLNVEVLSDGSVGRIGVHQSSGARDLDQAAITAVKKWQFSPAQLKGVGVAQIVRVPVKFSLNQVEAR